MIVNALYSVLRFFANWLQQPTVIKVAGSISTQQQQKRGHTPKGMASR